MLEKHKQLEGYTVLYKVGEGQYGKVYKAIDRSLGILVAIKVIYKNTENQKNLNSYLQEVRLLNGLNHPHIIKLLKYFETPENIYIVTEFCKSNLFDYTAKNGKYLRTELIRSIALQLLSALLTLHLNGIIHHDLKTENILVGYDKRVKLCDFGLAIHLRKGRATTPMNMVKGTLLYMAPELLLNSTYNYKIDFWALGVILYELFVGKVPFDGNSEKEIKRRIIYGSVKWPKTIPSQLRDLISGLLQTDPNKRFSWVEIRKHPFLHSTLTEDEMLKLDALNGQSVDLNF